MIHALYRVEVGNLIRLRHNSVAQSPIPFNKRATGSYQIVRAK